MNAERFVAVSLHKDKETSGICWEKKNLVSPLADAMYSTSRKTLDKATDLKLPKLVLLSLRYCY